MRDHRLDVGEEKKMDDARGVPHVAEEGHNQFKGTTVQSTTNVGLRKQDPHASNNNNSRPASSEAPTTAAPVPPSAASPTAPPTKKNSQPFGRFARWVGTFIRLLLLDAPLTLLFAAVLLVGSFERYAHTILLPQIELMRFADSPTKVERGLTYYHRLCTAADQTATDPSAFTLSATSDTTTTTTQQAVHLMLKHGITIIPNVLSESTATQLRDFILRENAVTKDLIHVIANEHRWSFPIRVDQDPIVTQALEELLNAPRLVRILEAVAGPNPAIVEFTAITQEYGAKEQFWHQDGTHI